MSTRRSRVKFVRGLLSIPLILLALTLPAYPQGGVSIRVATEPEGVRYLVDGQLYHSSQSFLWAIGSKHIVSVLATNFRNPGAPTVCDEPNTDGAVQYEQNCRARYGFTNWKTDRDGDLPGATSQTQVITVDGSFSQLTAVFRFEYRIELVMPRADSDDVRTCLDKANRPGAPPRPGESIGIVFFDSLCFDYGATLWMPPGEYGIQAMPLTGYAFRGWNLDGAIAPSVTTYRVRGPATIVPLFVPAKRVTFYTEPRELRVRVDRTEIWTRDPADNNLVYPTPGVYDWLPGSTHVIGAPSPQLDRETGAMFVFAAWSNGGGQDAVYRPDSETARRETLVAKFVRGVHVSFFTEPRGLRLNVDDRENWPGYGFTWGLGSTHRFAPLPEQTDANGRLWTFKGWKHGGPAAQDIHIDQKAIESGGITYIAVYEAVPQVTLRSSLPGMEIQVDGSPCASPCVLDRPAGTQIRVSVPERVEASEVARHEFTGWSDTGHADRMVVFDRETIELTAGYRQLNKLSIAVDPAEGAEVNVHPGSDDGFYPAGSTVALSIAAKSGFRFRRWEGDATGTGERAAVKMDAPRMVQALLVKTDSPGTARVVNAAGETPGTGVAAGSLISIVGSHLSPVTQAGPASPLAQAIGGVAVTVGDRILPLLFVSPEQINALLPSDLREGEHRLTVRASGLKEVSTVFTVVRNAPGLLSTPTETGPVAVAIREDGSAVTHSNLARPGEVITLVGTGFGPYDRQLLDGFAVPVSPVVSVTDVVEVRLDDVIVKADWTGAAPGLTGVTAVRVRVPADAHGTRIASAIVNGVESNAVALPVE